MGYFVDFVNLCWNIGYYADFGKLCWFWFCNLIDMAKIMSYGGDVGDDPSHLGGSRFPGQCEFCKYYDSYTFDLF